MPLFSVVSSTLPYVIFPREEERGEIAYFRVVGPSSRTLPSPELHLVINAADSSLAATSTFRNIFEDSRVYQHVFTVFVRRDLFLRLGIIALPSYLSRGAGFLSYALGELLARTRRLLSRVWPSV
jgi:hypothetical protein